MYIIYGLLLFVMGVLAAQDVVKRQIPASEQIIIKTNPYSEVIGFTGLLLGLLWLIRALTLLSYLSTIPVFVLETWLVALLMVSVGLILGLSLVYKFLQPAPVFMATVEKWRLKLLPYQKQLGIAAIVVGIIYLF